MIIITSKIVGMYNMMCIQSDIGTLNMFSFYKNNKYIFFNYNFISNLKMINAILNYLIKVIEETRVRFIIT